MECPKDTEEVLRRVTNVERLLVAINEKLQDLAELFDEYADEESVDSQDDQHLNEEL